MPSDLRWAGGIANRTWSAGLEAEHLIDHDRIRHEVAAYLTDVRTHRPILRASDHPTVESCLKVIFQRWPEERAVIAAEYQRQASQLQAVSDG